ncbi:cell division protein ZapB [bacterium]|nr:cell division protein ZapB [bacterium]
MEILDQLQSKVRNAVQKIEELQGRVTELEEIKKQYEDKMASLVQEFGSIDSSSVDQPGGSDSENGQSEGTQSQESLYRHQY